MSELLRSVALYGLRTSPLSLLICGLERAALGLESSQGIGGNGLLTLRVDTPAHITPMCGP
ncbi:MAG: hypothetical protein ABR941_02755 [Thermoleophilia bacterium]